MGALVAAAVERGDVVVSVGGDGMLSSLAGLVSAAGGTLGVVPAGRGNDFARMLGLPSDPAEVAALLLDGEVRQVDLISLTLPGAAPRLVAGSVYSGVDARAGEIVDRSQWLPRKAQYPWAALRALATYSPARYLVSVDGDEREYAAANVVVANSAYYGSGMKIAPAAAVADGVLDVVVIEAASKLALMRSLPKVYDGGHVSLPEVTVLTGKRVELRADSSPPGPGRRRRRAARSAAGAGGRARRGRGAAGRAGDHRLSRPCRAGRVRADCTGGDPHRGGTHVAGGLRQPHRLGAAQPSRSGAGWPRSPTSPGPTAGTTGPPGPSRRASTPVPLRAAARCAFWLGFGLMDEGRAGRGAGWLARADELLGDLDCAERGLLLTPVALGLLESGDAAGGARAVHRDRGAG